MGMLNHSKNKNPDKNVKVNVQSVTRSEAGFTDNDEPQVPTFDVSMRISNHTRNAILALSKIEDSNANGTIADVMDEYVKKLDNQQLHAYHELFNTFEQKDLLMSKLKK
jgi:hypothetical protein